MVITPELREKCINTIKFLSIDAVERAKSGHPGTPMGAADIAFVLWNKFLRYNPKDPEWPNRDRFVLSAGHASSLLYSLLHLSDYDISLEEIKRFRQWESITPGHPEVSTTAGVECTTGPLGAGFGNAVGMALAAKINAARFNTEEYPLMNPFIYVLCSDGDIQEGVCAEASALAGHWGLGNLIAIYDMNDTTIAGDLSLSYSEVTSKRFEACGWHVQECDGHNHEEIEKCLEKAKEVNLKPSIIIATTIIGKGSPNKAGSSAIHGAPLGEKEIISAKEKAGWPLDPFYVPEDVRTIFNERKIENEKYYSEWKDLFQRWSKANPEYAELWEKNWNGKITEDLLTRFIEVVDGKENATRSISEIIIQDAADLIPNLIGGSADLEPSNKTYIKNSKSIIRSSVDSHDLPDPSFSGRNIHYGIREHAMGSICNGLFLFGGLRSFCATFSVFSDYMRPTFRLAALSKLPTIFVLTHDSFWVGEDGPTHQPIEQNWTLRLIPRLYVWRPADAMETAAAWAYSLNCPNGYHPNVLLLTRQKVKNLDRESNFDPKLIWKGAYIVREAEGNDPKVILASTGSESKPVQEVQNHLQNIGIPVRHVSIPCWDLFREQDKEYRNFVFPENKLVIMVEAGRRDPWYQIADYVIGLDEFGKAGPGEILADKFGFTAERLIENITDWLSNHGIKGK